MYITMWDHWSFVLLSLKRRLINFKCIQMNTMSAIVGNFMQRTAVGLSLLVSQGRTTQPPAGPPTCSIRSSEQIITTQQTGPRTVISLHKLYINWLGHPYQYWVTTNLYDKLCSLQHLLQLILLQLQISIKYIINYNRNAYRDWGPQE